MSAAQFFTYCLYALIGTVVLCFCISLVVMLVIRLRKQWRESK
jgi:hypothetical protein